MIDMVGLDGDDTLWHSESHFVVTEDALADLLSPYAEPTDLRLRMLATERRNLALFGYGVKGFTLSMIETAIEVSNGQVSVAEIQAIIDAGKGLLAHPVELLDGVTEAIDALSGRVRLVVITKGDLFHQESKAAASGLVDRVEGIEIVAEKDIATYRRILARHAVAPDRFLMVGNSVRSDILPVLELGSHAAHVPYHVTWEVEVVEPPDVGHERFRALTSLRDLPALLDELGA
ncbi:MAG: HAD family hydrolase [Acidimicrobiia bacterium]|nr:HAD family hydrolase [Acidimicrobiia bacterium]